MPLPSDVKNQQVRERGKTLGEAGADWSFGSTAKSEADEHRAPNAGGLRGPDKRQSELRDEGRGTYSQPNEDGGAGERTPQQNAQHGADVRGQPSMVQRNDNLPEGLRRERKGPYDKNVGRAEEATQVPKNR